MLLIPLTQGQVSKVDNADYEWLCQWKWHAAYSPRTRTYYAKREGERRDTFVYMARAILKVVDPKVQIDHRNGDTLDNQRENLRIATPAQNAKNRKRNKNNTSGAKGVDWHCGGWRVRIGVDKKSVFIGRFSTLEEAKKAYVEKALELHKDFARVECS